jgi:hypothetical protein
VALFQSALICSRRPWPPFKFNALRHARLQRQVRRGD